MEALEAALLILLVFALWGGYVGLAICVNCKERDTAAMAIAIVGASLVGALSTWAVTTIIETITQ